MEIFAALWIGVLTFFGQAPVEAQVATVVEHVSAPRPTLEQFIQSSVKIKNKLGHGSGVFIGPTRVLTNGHVAKYLDETTVISSGNGDKFKPTGVVRAGNIDLAMITVDQVYTGWLPKVSCDSVPRLTNLTNVGNPIDVEFMAQVVQVTKGFDPKIEQMGMTFFRGVALEGASGSPMFTDDGKVVGLLTMSLMITKPLGMSGLFDLSTTGLGGYVGFDHSCEFATWKAGS